MGYDAYFYVKKKKYTKKDVEKLLLLMGYKKNYNVFWCGDDKDYKYDNGVAVYPEETDSGDEIVYHVRLQIWANGYDLRKANDTLRSIKKYCDAWFETDYGRNRYFPEDDLIDGAENGCYIAASRAYENMQKMKHSISNIVFDSTQERIMVSLGQISNDILNANVYTAFLCAILEEFFRFSYTAILRFSDRRDSLIKVKLSPYDLIDVDSGKRSLDEVYARTLSFQNINRISDNFQTLDKIDIGSYLKKPYHSRKKNLYVQVNELFERRHNMVHQVKVDRTYNSKKLMREIHDMEEVVDRVYKGLCTMYSWEIRDYK